MESTTIKALFGRRNIRFVIPAYQRAYAWEKRQFIQFIEDLEECEVSDYYLGHFLFEQDGDTFYVIDGQQRLTTCIIFFRAFINTLKHREAEWINEKESDTIKNWIDDDNRDGNRAESIKVQLYAKYQQGVEQAFGNPVELSASTKPKWFHIFTDLPAYVEGTVQPIEYLVKEIPAQIDGYVPCQISGESGKGYTLTNSHTPLKIKSTFL